MTSTLNEAYIAVGFDVTDVVLRKEDFLGVHMGMEERDAALLALVNHHGLEPDEALDDLYYDTLANKGVVLVFFQDDTTENSSRLALTEIVSSFSRREEEDKQFSPVSLEWRAEEFRKALLLPLNLDWRLFFGSR